ncbi:MAG: hypothetical protein J6W42_04605 [Bacteroidaceae bacterium]|nr:hypothetical protein [Bacteroidaceae bacterium]
MGNYDWQFSTIGGKNRVNIKSGEDIKHLGELDQKLWTVLSSPVTGLEFDAKTLKMLDYNNDGRIHVHEVVQAAEWITSILKDPDMLLKKEDTLPLSAINTDNPDGARLLASAQQILKNLGLEKDSISVADADDSVAIFAKTGLNGDGIITVQSTEDEELQKTIEACVASVGGKTDRSGLQGVDADLLEAFYKALADYSAWQKKAADDKTVFAFGDNTAAVYDIVNQIKAKVADYFMRCKLAAFHAGSVTALDVSVARIETISDKDLSQCADEISNYPLARISANNTMPIDERINPVWQATIGKLKALALDKEFEGASEITEEQWNAFVAKLAPYEAWLGEKAGAQVEALGLDQVNAILKADRKADLLKIIDDDKALEAESLSIDEVAKLLHLYRDFYTFLCNFVSFRDFYDPDGKAIFQAGELYIDERCCELCIKVPDMGPHASATAISGMFILYCNCVDKITGNTMIIAAIMTDGDVADLREGKHGLFYDRKGVEWDATVFKIVENPISIRQAFWAPYRKIGRYIETTIEKRAAEKDNKVMADMTAKVDNAGKDGAAGAEKKKPFDIAAFAGIFAAIGLAVSGLAAALAKMSDSVSDWAWWKWLILVVVIMLVISGPSMILAWLKIRKRNLSPLLNANGWAINASVKVNMTFGATLTEVGKSPLKAEPDPFADKTPWWKKLIYWLLGIGLVFWICYSNNWIEKWTDNAKWHYEKKDKKTEAPAEKAESMIILTSDAFRA